MWFDQIVLCICLLNTIWITKNTAPHCTYSSARFETVGRRAFTANIFGSPIEYVTRWAQARSNRTHIAQLRVREWMKACQHFIVCISFAAIVFGATQHACPARRHVHISHSHTHTRNLEVIWMGDTRWRRRRRLPPPRDWLTGWLTRIRWRPPSERRVLVLRNFKSLWQIISVI